MADNGGCGSRARGAATRGWTGWMRSAGLGGWLGDLPGLRRERLGKAGNPPDLRRLRRAHAGGGLILLKS